MQMDKDNNRKYVTSNPDVYSVLKENAHRNRTALTADLRTDYLNKHGYYVMRFKNEEILGDIRSVTEKIKYLIDKTRK